MTSKADRRKFLKYVGAGLVAATAAGAGYYLYSEQPGYGPSQTVTIPKGWETASTYLRNNPPVISRIDVKPKYINPTTETTIRFTHSAYDPDNDQLSTTWLIDGELVGHEQEYSTKLPEGDHSILLKVSDGKSEATKYAPVTVEPEKIYPTKPLNLKYKGVRYSAQQQTPELPLHVISREEMDEQLDTIRHELGCNAIYINAGRGYEDDLLECGRLAVEKGFERIYIQPAYMNLPIDETIELIGKFSERVTSLTDTSDAVVFSVGHEFYLETSGIIPGDNWWERMDYQVKNRDWRDRVNANVPKVFEKLMPILREKYPDRPIAYAAAIPEVDLVPWSDPAFESVCTDAYVMEAEGVTEDWIFDLLSRLKRYGKPVHSSEAGCMTFSGANELGGIMTLSGYENPYDEDEQAKYIQRYCNLLNRARIDGYFYTQYNDDFYKGYGLYDGKKRKKGFYMYKSYKRTG